MIAVNDAKRKLNRQEQLKAYNQQQLAAELTNNTAASIPTTSKRTGASKPKAQCPHCSKEYCHDGIHLKNHIAKTHPTGQ